MISVIVPVYKVEKYVAACIESLLNQKYRNFEIIIVDDGSPDESMKIVEMVLKEDKDIPVQIIKKSNEGVSSARNAGIEAALGEYIVMVDSDDVVSSDFLGNFVKMIERYPSNDIYSLGFSVCLESNYGEFEKKSKPIKCLSWKAAQVEFLNRSIKFLLPTLLLRKDFINKNNVKFDKMVRYSEDVQFIWRCLAYNRKKVIHSETVVYHYILHQGSTMTSSNIEKIKTGVVGLKNLYEETCSLYCNEVKKTIVPQSYFALLHGASRMLSKNDFKKLYIEANCKPYIKFQSSEGMIKVRIVSIILSMFPTLGYYIMRRF